MFNDIQEQMEQSQRRWEEMNKIKQEIEENLKQHPDTATDQNNILTTKLLLLLVEQLQPVAGLDSQKLQDSLKGLIDAFSGDK